MFNPKLTLSVLAVAVCAASLPVMAEEESDSIQELDTVVVQPTAEESLKQMPGVSVISAEDIEKRAPVNDLSDIIRRMPGVNLTGNSSTGQRGNNRQIDLRGMGPENTLILIDGKPVSSRNSVRYGKSGERDTRGDSNWVPVDAVERIEVLRGPAAARYGSGSAGGVVNIITKKIPEETKGSVTVYANEPQHKEEGDTRRITGNIAGPLSDEFSYRLYGNLNRTDADDPDINVDETEGTSIAAGREGVRNTDLNGMLRWAPSDKQSFDLSYGYSRQSNIYAGDTGLGNSAVDEDAATGTNPESFLGKETNRMSRYTTSLQHDGIWDFGTSKSYLQYEKTENRRLAEGLVGGTEGRINTDEKYTSLLEDYVLHSEVVVPFTTGMLQTVTAGVEVNYMTMDDPATINLARTIVGYEDVDSDGSSRDPANSQTLTSAFIEDSIQVSSALELIPGLRVDHSDKFGVNLSPSLNAAYAVTDTFTVKGGVARAFKAPNLYQSHPNYVHYSSGNGCNKTLTYTTRCYLLGNEDLDPEISVNKELGINWNSEGWNLGLTWFRNDYDNKISVGSELIAIVNDGTGDQYVYQWENATDAIIEGYEANALVPLADMLSWTTNVTYMDRNDDQNGQPLSIIPEYTVNTMLDWSVTEALNVTLTGTFYGKQEPRTVTYNTAEASEDAELNTVDPYSLWGLNAGYRFNDQWNGRVGVSNLMDKRLFRAGNSSSAGAQSYNEPGRAFYVSMTASF